LKLLILILLFPLISTANTLKVSGKLHFGYTRNNYPSSVDSSLSGFQIRRARLRVSGKLSNNYFYKQEVDLSGASIKMKDAYLGKILSPNLKIYLGYKSLPTSLSDRLSSNSLIFPERSGLNRVIGSKKRVGITSQFLTDQYWIQIGAQEQTNSKVDDPIREHKIGGSIGGLSLAGDLKLHHSLGGYKLSKTGRETVDSSLKDSYKLKLKAAGSDLTDVYGLETGSVSKIDSQDILFIDTFFLFKNIYIGSEATSIVWNRSISNIYHSTWMIETSYVFGNNFRKYKKNGSISSPDLNGEDAFELAFRFENYNLSNETESLNQKDIGVSVNYFENENVSYMVGVQESLVKNSDTYSSFTVRTNLKY
jgi:phosphate-selective porin